MDPHEALCPDIECGLSTREADMARLLLHCLSFGPPFPSASNHSISTVPILVLRLQRNIIPQPRSFNGARVSSPSSLAERRVLIARASSETDGNESGEPGDTPPEKSEESVSVENLPLESKLQLKLEQKLRMKLAKKIRLRRKRLLRKRRMRKKGRWPPSKMKKLKNV